MESRITPLLRDWFPKHFLGTHTFVGVEYPPSLHNEELEDIREMQELALARNSSNSQARGG
ncbi:MAG: hypothetical protein WCF23_11005 [Candidatus Nitrosopolaris sp.]